MKANKIICVRNSPSTTNLGLRLEEGLVTKLQRVLEKVLATEKRERTVCECKAAGSVDRTSTLTPYQSLAHRWSSVKTVRRYSAERFSSGDKLDAQPTQGADAWHGSRCDKKRRKPSPSLSSPTTHLGLDLESGLAVAPDLVLESVPVVEIDVAQKTDWRWRD